MIEDFGDEYKIVLTWHRHCIDDDHAKRVVMHLLVEFIMRGAGIPSKIECSRQGSEENLFSEKDIVL